MWNVRSLNDTGRLTQVVAEMKKYQLGILGISEMRWTGSGSMVSEGVSVYYSGGSKHEKGVGILLSQEVTRAMLSWEPINDRIITMRIQSSHTKVTIIQAYAPTNAAQDQDKNEFYEQLQDILDAAPEHDLKIVMGDFNSQIGADNAGWEDTIGTEAIGERTDNGERLLSLCSTNKMKIGGSLFMHKNIHKGTWRSPDGQTVNQIDHFCISRRWATSLQDVRVHRGADVATDHYLVVAVVKVKLKNQTRKKIQKVLDVQRLKTAEIQQQFQLELSNRFSTLEVQESDNEHGVEEKWRTIKETIVNTAQEVVGFRRGSRKEQWISQNTWKAIDERRMLKARSDQAISTNKNVTEVAAAYRSKDKEVKSRCRADKTQWFEKTLTEAEEAAKRQDTKTLYRIVKALSGKTTQKLPISDDKGKPLKTQEEQAKRWKQHFSTILNCPEPTVKHDFSADPTHTLDINMEAITMEEVTTAIRKLKNGKSAGIDDIQAELLKHGGENTTRQIQQLCNRIWETGEVPRDWRDGIIIPLPKKGDLKDCNNWRGITLLSVPGKVMASILLNRIQGAVDDQLRQQQAGFRAGRSCCDQIFALRQIIDKVTALKEPLLINFIDFRKAFDCIHRMSVWNILRCYGIPEKVIKVIQSFYEDSRCAVRADGEVGEWFQIITGVRQGCVLSPMIFLLVMDWIMKRATDTVTNGLEWVNGERLTDLDFADDIALLGSTLAGMMDLTGKVETEAATVGLRINADKTKVMMTGVQGQTQAIQAGGKPVEEVNEFCYLGSVIARDGSCDKDIRTRLGKANSCFGRLLNIWRNKGLSIKIKIRLYEALVMSTLLYGAETWPMTVANMKRLEAAHHRWQRKILGIVWRDKITNVEVRRRTCMDKLEDIIRRRRLQWLGHVHRMEQERIPKQALNWIPAGKRKRGRPRMNWTTTIKKDMECIGMTWEEAETAAGDRAVWRSCVARCAAGTGRTK
jgi:hypothetical protein